MDSLLSNEIPPRPPGSFGIRKWEKQIHKDELECIMNAGQDGKMEILE
jgi:hypothetical protein